jgi:hypothetical protein
MPFIESSYDVPARPENIGRRLGRFLWRFRRYRGQ